MSRYRKIEVRIWSDEKFRALSPLPPSGQSLWLFLLTGPHTGPIPGLFRSGKMALAEELGWSSKAFSKAFAELEAQGMAKADWKNRVVWLPKSIIYNLPQSPNVIKSWEEELKLIPECTLKTEAIDGIKDGIMVLGEAYVSVFIEITHRKAFGKSSGNSSGKPSGKPMPNQEQEQEQEQEQKDISLSGAGAGEAEFLTDERRDRAAQQGFTDRAWLEAETVKFLNFNIGKKALRNIDGSWLNWLHKGREYAAKHPDTAQAAPAKPRKPGTVVVEQARDPAAYAVSTGRFSRPQAKTEESSNG